MKLYRILILVLCAYTLISCGGAEERKAVYMERAKSSIAAGDLDKARIELKNVLQIDPKDSNAYYQLGIVFEQLREFRKAYGNYLKTEELDPNNLANQAKLGRIYLLMANKPEKAQEKIDFILSKDSNSTEGLLLKALMTFKNGNKSEAMTIVEDVVGNNPGDVEGVALLTALYTKDGRLDDAIQILDEALNVQQDSIQLNKLLAQVLVQNKDYARAEVIYKKFIETNPDSSSSYNDLAAFYNQSGNVNKAEETYRTSIANDSDDVDRQLVLVRYIKETKGINKAIEEAKVLISKDAGFGKLRTALAELYYFNDDKQQAMDTYFRAINDFSDEVTGIEARTSLAAMYFNDKNYSKASEIVEEAINISPNNPKINFLRAKLAVHDNDIEKVILSLRIVTKETPGNIEAFLLLANAYKLENNEEQVRSTLNSAYENNRMNSEALLELAQFYLSRDIIEAEKVINDYNAIKKSDYSGLSIKSAILNQNKSYPEAYEIAEVLMDLYPDKPNGYLQAMPYLSDKKDKEKGVSILEAGYISAKDNKKILALLTTIQVSQKKFDVVKKRIKAEINAAPDDADLKILLSKVYRANNEIDPAISLLNEVIKDSSDIEEPYLLLAQIYQNKNNYSSVESVLKKGMGNVSSSMKIPLKLAVLYETEKSYSQAIDVYRELHNKYPDNFIVTNNLASMLSDYGNKDNDLALANELTDILKESGQPVFLDTVGWVYYKSGDYQNAIYNLAQVVEKSPKINIFNYHLGMAYKMAGDNKKAKIYLEKSLVNSEKFKEKNLAEAALKDL